MDLKSVYTEVRAHTEEICKPLQVEDYSIQVVKFASPAKWHLAHVTWFFETFILIPHLKSYESFNSNFNFLFNSYYNHVGDRILQANRGNMSRPAIEEIYEYRKYVDENVLTLLDNNISEAVKDLIVLGLNHEQQHQELLITDLKYMFGHNPLFPFFEENFNLLKGENTNSNRIKITGGVYEIGHQSDAFCYDNELGVHKVYLDDFEIDNHLVTNGDYITFIKSGGYTDFNYWLDEGWSWVNSHSIHAPLYWHKIKGKWHQYTLAGLQEVNPSEILSHISFYEANAFAEWKGMRLPTEFEWEIAAQQLNWGKRWEWTSSAYLPYPNFKKENGAVGEYNGKFMSNKMVLRGASVATSKNHSRNTYRNFFSPEERWQFTGIRLVK